MRHLAGIVAQADALIERVGAQPYRPVFDAVGHDQPQPDMVATARALAFGPFEGQVLTAAVIQQLADRRRVVGTVQQHAADDLQAGAGRHRIGRIPPGGLHGADDVVPVADQADIHRIPRNAGRGARDHRPVGKARLTFVVPPRHRQGDIGQAKIGHERRHQDDAAALDQRSPAWRHTEHFPKSVRTFRIKKCVKAKK